MQELICLITSSLFIKGIEWFFMPAADSPDVNMLLLISFCASFAAQYYVVKTGKRGGALSLVFGALYALILIIGKNVYTANGISRIFRTLPNLLRTILAFIGFSAVLSAFLDLFFAFISNQTLSEKTVKAKIMPLFVILWIGIFIAWLPTLLAFWPGMFSYDIPNQTMQIMTGSITRFHPPLHTLFWSACLGIGNAAGIEPITIYSLLQMLILSAAMARVLTCLFRNGISRIGAAVCVAFFAFNPVIAIFSIEPTKDVFFAAFFALMIVEALEIFESTDGELPLSPMVHYVVFGTLACLFRNNAVYAFLLWIPFVIGFVKVYRVRAIALAALPAVLFFIINGPVYSLMGISEGRPKEALSIPIQQIASVVYWDGDSLTEEERAEIDRYLPVDEMREAYNFRFSDPVKYLFHEDEYKKDKTGFFRVWLRLFRRYPAKYINAALTLNVPYWYPLTEIPDPYSKRQYIEIDNKSKESNKYYFFENSSKLPELKEFLTGIADFSYFNTSPIISLLMQLAVPLWFILLTLFVQFRRREYTAALPVWLMLLFLLTYLAGPVSNFRYIFPLFCLYPVLFCLITRPDSNE